jgi:hypothetical protein
MDRWKCIVGIFKRGRKLKNVEKIFARKWLREVGGEEVSIWMRKAGKIRIPYAKGLTGCSFSTRCAEEEFLDEYYKPRIGIRLNMRQQAIPMKSRGQGGAGLSHS